MPKPTITILNVETGEVEEREMTAAEFAQYEADQKSAADESAAKQAAEEAKSALLAKLGITADEAKLLLS